MCEKREISPRPWFSLSPVLNLPAVPLFQAACTSMEEALEQLILVTWAKSTFPCVDFEEIRLIEERGYFQENWKKDPSVGVIPCSHCWNSAFFEWRTEVVERWIGSLELAESAAELAWKIRSKFLCLALQSLSRNPEWRPSWKSDTQTQFSGGGCTRCFLTVLPHLLQAMNLRRKFLSIYRWQ